MGRLRAGRGAAGLEAVARHADRSAVRRQAGGALVPPGKKAVLLCRSGVRSIAAAKRATEIGIEAYNILEGFEGDPDAEGHRNTQGGWRMRGLPWRQG